MTSTTPTPAPGALLSPESEDWWAQAAIYQIYPRSFADGNGDGIGDFVGVLSKVDYIASLNVDAVWFSPFYPSALADGGYDVDDYRDVDPKIGTLSEFQAVIDALHERGIRVVIDLVPNHCSNRHVWFKDALAASPGSPERERFWFRDGTGENGDLPPNDWQSMFGGPAWSRITESDGTPGQWYLHLFTPEQPDWNWENPEVREDFLTTLRFWGDRGVNGFRVDVASGLAKDMSEPFPTWERVNASTGFLGVSGGADESSNDFEEGNHPLFDRDELTEIYREWREVFNTYDPPLFAVAEAWVPAHRQARYASKDSLGQSFNFDLLSAPWDISKFRSIITKNLGLASANGSSSTWVFSNHDVVRHPSRYAQSTPVNALQGRYTEPDDAGASRGLGRAHAATLMALALPGSAYIYQGEELGLPEVFGIPAEDAQDPSAVIEDGVVVIGRDGCRVPLPWDADSPFFGFSSGASHLPQPSWFAQYAVDAESKDSGSSLSLYRRALELRHELQSDENVEWLDLGEHVLAFVRANGWTSITNFGPEALQLPDGKVLLRTDNAVDAPSLASEATVWMKRN